MESHNGSAWSQQDEQELRPYALTGGRTRPTHEMHLASLLKAKDSVIAGGLSWEAEQVLTICRGEPRSVAEVAATLQQPVQVAKILLSDLLDSGALGMAAPHAPLDPRDPRLLEAVLAGLRQKFAV